jgi:hypothetical protein
MDAKYARSGLCWFFASALAVSSFVLALVAIDRSAAAGWSALGFALLVASAVALVGTAVLIGIGLRLDRRGVGRR